MNEEQFLKLVREWMEDVPRASFPNNELTLAIQHAMHVKEWFPKSYRKLTREKKLYQYCQKVAQSVLSLKEIYQQQGLPPMQAELQAIEDLLYPAPTTE